MVGQVSGISRGLQENALHHQLVALDQGLSRKRPRHQSPNSDGELKTRQHTQVSTDTGRDRERLTVL